MKMTPVKSSNIESVGYDELNLTLHVEFKNGKTFAYKNVYANEYNELLNADSVGKHFNQFIKHGTDAVEVVKAVEPQAVTYTINGKEWTELDINKRCAELVGINAAESVMQFGSCLIPTGRGIVDENFMQYDPCNNPADTDAIIDKCCDELMSVHMNDYYSNWIFIMSKHNCTKLVAACICYIEINEGKL